MSDQSRRFWWRSPSRRGCSLLRGRDVCTEESGGHAMYALKKPRMMNVTRATRDVDASTMAYTILWTVINGLHTLLTARTLKNICSALLQEHYYMRKTVCHRWQPTDSEYWCLLSTLLAGINNSKQKLLIFIKFTLRIDSRSFENIQYKFKKIIENGKEIIKSKNIFGSLYEPRLQWRMS